MKHICGDSPEYPRESKLVMTSANANIYCTMYSTAVLRKSTYLCTDLEKHS